MSKDKYLSIFSPQMEAIVFIILQIFYAMRAVLKIGEYPRIFPSFSWGIFAHVTRLDQLRASENILWIISGIIKGGPGDNTCTISQFILYLSRGITLAQYNCNFYFIYSDSHSITHKQHKKNCTEQVVYYFNYQTVATKKPLVIIIKL